ncbi:MAG: DNA-binding response regulator [Sphingomonas sp.]|nr:MAG: DNA-binding response regulator [Sphingomonas sp.]
MRILMVEDEAELARRTIASLARAGITAEWLASAEDAAGFAGDGFNALIVDLGLPGMGGLELVRLLRRRGVATPILILTARGSWEEKVEGLNAGADDFLVKPVRAEELIARLHALARRVAGHVVARLEEGQLALDTETGEAWLADAPVELTKNEFRLLRAFLLEPGRTLSREAILDRLYALETERDPNTVEVLIGRLRRKIGHARVATMRGFGYRLMP